MQWCAGHRWKLEVTLPKTPFEFKVRGLNDLLAIFAYPKLSGARGLSVHAPKALRNSRHSHVATPHCMKGTFKNKTFHDASLPGTQVLMMHGSFVRWEQGVNRVVQVRGVLILWGETAGAAFIGGCEASRVLQVRCGLVGAVLGRGPGA